MAQMPIIIDAAQRVLIKTWSSSLPTLSISQSLCLPPRRRHTQPAPFHHCPFIYAHKNRTFCCSNGWSEFSPTLRCLYCPLPINIRNHPQDRPNSIPDMCRTSFNILMISVCGPSHSSTRVEECQLTFYSACLPICLPSESLDPSTSLFVPQQWSLVEMRW